MESIVNPPRRRGVKVRTYLALTAVAVVVPVCLSAAAALDMLLSSEREAALWGVRETARAAALAVDRELAGAEAGLRVLAASAHLADGDLPAFYEQARRASAGGDNESWIVLFDRDGRQLLNTLRPYGAPLPTRRRPERGLEVIRTQKPVVTSVTLAPVSKRPVVAFEAPVPVDNGQRYVLSQAFPAEYFNRAALQPAIPASWVVGIYDQEGVTIARSRRAGDFVGKRTVDKLVQAMRHSPDGVLRTQSMEGDRVYAAYTRSKSSGWTVAVGVPEEEIEAAARRAVLLSGLGLLAALACALTVGAVLARRLGRSISAAASSALGLGQGRQPQFQASGVAEVDALQQALVEAGELLRRERESRAQAESERARLFASEQEARRMAETQNRAKDEFLAMLGHELRNPLGAIMNASVLMATPGIGEDKLRRAHEVVGRQSSHLSRIVDDLLDVSRVVSGKVFLERSRLDLAQAVRGATATLQAARRTGEHRIAIDVEPAWIDADPTRIEQVITNLLLNACKYTPGSGTIELRVRAEDGWAVLTVRDPGIGIAPQLLPSIFDVFVQGPAQLDRAQGGLGIGLALVQRLAQLHGGSVGAESAGTGQGSTFTVRLPLAAPATSEAPPQLAPDADVRRVLLIEDSEDNRQTLAAMLETHGHSVWQAGDGIEGIRLAQQLLPDAAVVDIGLPGMDGFAVARRLRAGPGTSGMRLIALTGYGQAEDRQRALEAGFDLHLVKPVQDMQLLHALRGPTAAAASPGGTAVGYPFPS